MLTLARQDAPMLPIRGRGGPRMVLRLLYGLLLAAEVTRRGPRATLRKLTFDFFGLAR